MRVRLGGFIAAIACSALLTAQAGAAEHVEDGGFDEQTTCDPTTCSSTAWGYVRYSGLGGTIFGPICNPSLAACLTGSSGYTTAPNWVRLGGGTGAMNTDKFVTSLVQQPVSIPAGGTATLRFALRKIPGNGYFFFIVKLDDTVVYFAHEGTAGFTPNFAPVTVDVSSFAGGNHLLEFEGTANFSQTNSTTFDIDDVSLTDTPFPAAPADTGQRAAALKKCKKKRGRAKAKCKKKAALLPV